MSRFFNVAMVQLSVDLSTQDFGARKAEQRARIDRYLDMIMRINPVVDLFVLPETISSGYDPPNWVALAEPIPGPTSDFFCETARLWARGSVQDRSSRREWELTGS
jgi:predicted amidohydrolase